MKQGKDEHALVIANSLFQQHKRRLYTWTSPDGQHQNQKKTNYSKFYYVIVNCIKNKFRYSKC